MATRSKTNNSAFGQPAELPQAMIPSKADVYKYYLFVVGREQVSSHYMSTSKDCYRIVAKDVANIWDKFSFPHITLEAIYLRIERLVEDALRINKIPIARRNDTFYGGLQKFNEMFDICTCHCYENKILRKDCRCEMKIPIVEWESFVGQKTRKNQLGSIDRVTTGARRRTQIRDEKLASHSSKNVGRGRGLFFDKHTAVPSTSTDVMEVSEVESMEMEVGDYADDDNVDRDPDYFENIELEENMQNRFTYNNLAITVDRYRISSRAAAAVNNSILKDLDLLTEFNMLDRKKVERERKRVGKTLVKSNKTDNTRLECIGFDGRKDSTKTKKGMEPEEHYVIVNEPNDQYVTHLTPDNGTARCISEEIITFLIDYESKDSLKALLCDAAPVNTGQMGGVIKTIEVYIEKPVQWLICLLHANELPFRHVFMKIDGKPSGPTTFRGTIGQEIQKDLTKLGIVKFQPVPSKIQDISEDIISEFSSDQKYLFDICLAIKTGHLSASLASRSPGALNHSRWLTTANRILRLYVSTEAPTKNLKDIVLIIVQIYAPGWFWIKRYPRATDGARNFWYMMKLCKGAGVDKKYLDVMQKSLQQNAYFAHTENILLCMLSDDRQHIRELAVCRILQARNENINERHFQLPKLYFGTDDYSNMIDWSKETITQPPIIRDFSNEEISNIVNQPLNTITIPCHSQGVERLINIVTLASQHRIGYNSRHEYILNTLESRKMMPRFEFKRQWNI